MSKCSNCKKEFDGHRFVTFEHRGFKFRIFISGYECAHCKTVKSVERFEEYGRELVQMNGNEIKINWSLLRTKYWHRDEFVEILLELGILSLEEAGNWELVEIGPIGCNPRAQGLIYTYFVREEDARAYALMKFGPNNNSLRMRRTAETKRAE